VQVEGPVAPELRGNVSRYVGFDEETAEAVERREGPATAVVLIFSFGEPWLIDGDSLVSFAGGLRDRQATTRHEGRAFGIHVELDPPSAHRIFGLPLYELAYAQAPLEELLGEPHLEERLHDAGSWEARFALLDQLFGRRLRETPPPSSELAWAWHRLRAAHGNVRIGELAGELGWSRKRLAASFREQVGLPAKTAARVLRFERARTLAAASPEPDWARIALEAGYYDQSHLVNEFRSITGKPPGTFFQDAAPRAA
jgi:AraC-like DNA-binding protein